MAALINMEMPKACNECELCQFNEEMGESWCGPKESLSWDIGLEPEYRPDGCPLKDVPDIHFGNISEFSNRSTDCISRQEAIDAALSFIVEYCGAAFDEDMQMKLKQRLEESPSIQSEIIRCKDCRYSEYDYIFHSRYCHNKGKAEMVGDDFFCAAGRYQTNGSD